jgi:hypothetical protein
LISQNIIKFVETKKRKKSERIGLAHPEPLEASLRELARECLLPARYATHWVPLVRFTQMGWPIQNAICFLTEHSFPFSYYFWFLDILIFLDFRNI